MPMWDQLATARCLVKEPCIRRKRPASVSKRGRRLIRSFARLCEMMSASSYDWWDQGD
jgi:hypothetical protein